MKRADTFLTGCPCDSGRPYVDCCEPLHRGAPAQSAVALMRSRYSAYVLHLAGYLLATWHPLTRPSSLGLAEDAGNGMRWLGLRVMAAREDGDEAVVEFVARYRVGGASA